MLRLLCAAGQPGLLHQHCWSVLQELQLARSSAAAVVRQLNQGVTCSCTTALHETVHLNCCGKAWHSTSSSISSSNNSSSNTGTPEVHQHQKQQQSGQQHLGKQQYEQQHHLNADDVVDTQAVQHAAAAPRRQRDASRRGGGFVTLPQRATASGYPESFTRPMQHSGADLSSGSGPASVAGGVVQQGLQPVQLPAEQLRIQLRAEVQQQEQADEVDAYSLSRSLVSDSQSFDLPAAAAAAEADADQQQQQLAAGSRPALSASDKQLLEKLVGILTKEGKKSRARRIVLDAMHIIKQQVAKGQNVA